MNKTDGFILVLVEKTKFGFTYTKWCGRCFVSLENNLNIGDICSICNTKYTNKRYMWSKSGGSISKNEMIKIKILELSI